MATIADAINSGLIASSNLTRNQYLPEQLRLANQYQGLVNSFYGPEHQAALERAQQINQYYPDIVEQQIKEKKLFNENPLLRLNGAAGAIGGLMYLDKNSAANQQANIAPGGYSYTPINNASSTGLAGNNQVNYSEMLRNNLQNDINSKVSRAQYDQERAQGYSWNQLTAEMKNSLTAQGLAMGVDPSMMRSYINQGMTIPQIAKKVGLDPDNLPQPIYPPTTATKTRVQQQQQVGNELDYLSSASTAAIKPYANTFFGKSPKAISDMLSNDENKQKEFGRYLGALALQNEIANSRVLLAGGKSGIEIVRDLKNKSLAGINQIYPYKLTDTAFQEMQNFIDKTIQQGAKIRNMTGMNPFNQLGRSLSPNRNEKQSNQDPLGLRL